MKYEITTKEVKSKKALILRLEEEEMLYEKEKAEIEDEGGKVPEDLYDEYHHLGFNIVKPLLGTQTIEELAEAIKNGKTEEFITSIKGTIPDYLFDDLIEQGADTVRMSDNYVPEAAENQAEDENQNDDEEKEEDKESVISIEEKKEEKTSVEVENTVFDDSSDDSMEDDVIEEKDPFKAQVHSMKYDETDYDSVALKTGMLEAEFYDKKSDKALYTACGLTLLQNLTALHKGRGFFEMIFSPVKYYHEHIMIKNLKEVLCKNISEREVESALKSHTDYSEAHDFLKESAEMTETPEIKNLIIIEEKDLDESKEFSNSGDDSHELTRCNAFDDGVPSIA